MNTRNHCFEMCHAFIIDCWKYRLYRNGDFVSECAKNSGDLLLSALGGSGRSLQLVELYNPRHVLRHRNVACSWSVNKRKKGALRTGTRRHDTRNKTVVPFM